MASRNVADGSGILTANGSCWVSKARKFLCYGAWDFVETLGVWDFVHVDIYDVVGRTGIAWLGVFGSFEECSDRELELHLEVNSAVVGADIADILTGCDLVASGG